MKNQYIGDINDYRKYGLLRVLTDQGRFRAGICWMLTLDDGRSDGNFTSYLESPGKWKAYDPELFDGLARFVTNRERSVVQIEQAGVLPGATFYSALLLDAQHRQRAYFADAMRVLAECELVFFDPDNGLEIKSRPYGARDSSKHLFWREVEAFYGRGQSLLIYQHFISENREEFITRLSSEFERRVGTDEVWTFRTANVVFFLIPQVHHRKFFHERAAEVKNRWATQIQVSVESKISTLVRAE